MEDQVQHGLHRRQARQSQPVAALLRTGFSAVRRHGLVVVGFLGLALLWTFPVLLHLTTLVGGRGDALENYWNLWWVRTALLDLGQNPYRATYMHHPFGMPLYFHTLNLYNGLLGLPIQLLLGATAAFNLLNILALTMAGFGTYLLVWELTRHRAAAIVAGLIFAFCPYTAFHLRVGQSNLLSVQWMPFYLWALIKGVRDRWRWLLLASVFLLLNALVDWHHAVFSIVNTAVFGIVEALRLRRVRPVAILAGKLALVGGVFALLVSPLLVPMLREAQADPYAARPLWHSTLHSTDLLAFWLPNPLHPLWGGWSGSIFTKRLIQPNIVGGIASIGIVATLLGVYGVARDWRRSAFWLLLLLVGAILALGPYLQVGGVNSGLGDRPIPLPYLLFYQLPFMNILRTPSRFVSIVMLALAVLAGFGIAALARRPTIARLRVRQQYALWSVIGLLVLFENWPTPVGFQSAGPEVVSPFYRQLAAESGDFAILEVPYRPPISQVYQTYHGKRTVGGRISRDLQHPWLEARVFGPLIGEYPPTIDIEADPSPAGWRSELACQNVRYVVLYKDQLSPEQQAIADTLQQAYFADQAPVYEDETLRAYGPIEPTGSVFWTLDDDEWNGLETTPDSLRYRWIADGSGIVAYPCGGAAATLRFDTLSYAQQRHLQIVVNGSVAHTIRVEADTLTPIAVPIDLTAGPNRIAFRSVEPATSPGASDPRQLSFFVARLSITQP